MKDLEFLVKEYLATRRALGAYLAGAERMLRSFVAFLARSQDTFGTTPLALRWATEPLHLWRRRSLPIPAKRLCSGEREGFATSVGQDRDGESEVESGRLTRPSQES